MSEKPLKDCFVICPIGDEGTSTRQRSDQVLKHIIKPAARECGYKATRADEIDKPGLITSQVIQHVIGDPLVIADLTEMNPNVFYELAIRHATRRPLVQLIQKGERIPFDVAATRTIHVDHQDLDSAATARDQIISQIKELEASPDDIETPISMSLDLQNLKQSDNPEERSLAEVLSETSMLRSQNVKLAERIDAGFAMQGQHLSDQISFALKNSRMFGGGSTQKRNFRNVEYITQFATDIASSDKAMAVLVSIAPLQELAPWLFYAGNELHKALETRNPSQIASAKDRFFTLAEETTMHPLVREFVDGSDGVFAIQSITGFLAAILDHRP